MKHLSLVVLTILIFSSCAKDDNGITGENQAISDLKSTENQVYKRLIYKTLSPTEKTTFWISKIQEVSLNWGLNIEQKNLVKELISMINPSIFETKPTDVFTAQANDWTKRALGFFHYEQVFLLAYTIEISPTITDEIVPPPPDPDCDCHQGSIVTCLWHVEGECESKGCKVIQDDCGFLSLYDCDGRCENAMIPD